MDEVLARYYASKIHELSGSRDIESSHADADEYLCDLLKHLGYDIVVEEYYKLDKWYS